MLRRDATLDLDGEALTGVLVLDGQQLQRPAVGGLVTEEIIAPYVVDPLGTTPQTTILAAARTTLLPLFSRHFQPFLTPQPVDAFAVHTKTLALQERPGASVPVPRMTTNPLQHPLDQRSIAIQQLRLPSGLSIWVRAHLARA